MISFESSGSYKGLDAFLASLKAGKLYTSLGKYGAEGVAALSAATPKESGETAASWNYNVKVTRDSARITWTNSHIDAGVPIAIILQYGHGTGTGGYVAGRDYINPAMKPIFDKIAANVWREVGR